ncbi:steroid 17-alpha-hydroxylase/17,20 lyase-like isoform X2 [Lineus longissimus]|uniref:steroid 17-alpha-hydroxylase/17,20 lyase-like isoform X2 n=1 Tax=Lineus longissimus TaxID=88925 RepID=UPI00315D38D5
MIDMKEVTRLLIQDVREDPTYLCIFTLVFLMGILAYRRLYRKVYNLPPGPPTRFHHGNLKDFNKDPKIYLTLAEMANEYGSIYRVYTDEIQSDHYHGVIFAPYSERWKAHRKMLNQALRNFASGDLLVQNIHASMSIASHYLHPDLGKTYDPFQFVTLIIYNFICAMCVGKTFDPNDEEYKMLCFRRRSITDIIGNGFDADFFPYKRFLESKRINKAKDVINQLLNYAKSIIDDHRKGFSPGVIKDFTDHILASQRENFKKDSPEESKLHDRHLINTIMDIFSAGTETTVNTVYWVLLYVASYPEVQAKMHQQIDQNVGKNTLIDLKEKKKLPFIDATVFEVMRHRPAVPLGIPRSTICDTKIGKYDIPKDTDVIVNIWKLHHDPAEWDDPDVFKPERFLEEDGSLRAKPQAFLPFGVGRRICVGESVAKPEICLVTALLLQKYKFSLPPNRELSFKPADLAFTSYSKSYELVIEKR